MSTEALNIRIESSLYGLLKTHCVTNKITMTSWVQEQIIKNLGVVKPIDEAEKRRSEQEQAALEGAALYHEVVEVVHGAIKDLPLTKDRTEEQMYQLRDMAVKFKAIGLDPVDGVAAFIEQGEGLIQKGQIPVEILDSFKLTLSKSKLCMVMMKSFREMKLEEAVYTMEEPKK